MAAVLTTASASALNRHSWFRAGMTNGCQSSMLFLKPESASLFRFGKMCVRYKKKLVLFSEFPPSGHTIYPHRDGLKRNEAHDGWSFREESSVEQKPHRNHTSSVNQHFCCILKPRLLPPHASEPWRRKSDVIGDFRATQCASYTHFICINFVTSCLWRHRLDRHVVAWPLTPETEAWVSIGMPSAVWS